MLAVTAEPLLAMYQNCNVITAAYSNQYTSIFLLPIVYTTEAFRFIYLYNMLGELMFWGNLSTSVAYFILTVQMIWFIRNPKVCYIFIIYILYHNCLMSCFISWYIVHKAVHRKHSREKECSWRPLHDDYISDCSILLIFCYVWKHTFYECYSFFLSEELWGPLFSILYYDYMCNCIDAGSCGRILGFPCYIEISR